MVRGGQGVLGDYKNHQMIENGQLPLETFEAASSVHPLQLP